MHFEKGKGVFSFGVAAVLGGVRRRFALVRNRGVRKNLKPPRAPRVRNGFAHGLEYPHKKKLLWKKVRNAPPRKPGARAFCRAGARRIRMVGGF